ncbi:MAG: Ribose-phosphate pyrophosphokinase [Methanoregula sp. PtaU1.Bin051]|nr:MAG: Ribose-phosphate pyrophosphokinase [Methanoregula sp. PtaU1.Bin051]
MKVIGTERSQILAGRIADALKTEIIDVKFSKFPDGELYIRAGSLSDQMVVVGSVTDSDSFIELLLLIDACEGRSCRLVIPYMGYARQDKKFREGEPISARAIALALSRGVEECFTVNIHDRKVLSFFSTKARDLSVAESIGAYIKETNIANPLVLAPDDGASAFAQAVARTGGWDCDHLDKTRLSGDTVRIAPRNLDAKGRDVVIVDDIISTGGTIATAASMLTMQGARHVYAACVHGVLAGGAYARLKSAGIREIVCSDTIERGCSRYSAAVQIAHALDGC